MAGHFFLLKWSTISREAWVQLKCDSTESDAAGLQILAFPVVQEKMREGWRGTRMCFLLLREENKETRHVFLDCTLPEQVNTYVFPHRDTNSDCKRVCVKDVFPYLCTWCSKILTFGMCFRKNMGTRMCILMKIPKW